MVHLDLPTVPPPSVRAQEEAAPETEKPGLSAR